MTAPDPFDPLRQALVSAAGTSSDFDLNVGMKLRADRVLRPAAVLVALQPGPQGLDLVLTKRSSHLRHHPGQVAFPGGKIDPQDSGPEAAALREAQEEIALDPADVEVLGRFAAHETVTGFIVTPILARIHSPFTPIPEAGEVEEVFHVPLAHVADPARFRIEKRRWLGEWRRYYTIPYGPYYIWGATARILRGMAERMPR